MQFATLRYRNIVCRVTGCPPALLEFHTQGGHDTVDVVSTSFFLVTGVGGVESVLDWLLPLACPFHEERVSQAARRCSVLCWFSAECLPDSARLTQNSARLGRVLGTRCAHTGVSGPTPGGARPPPLMFCLIPGPPNAPPLSGGGGIASTLLLTRSRIDTGSRCARTPSPYECSSK